MTPEPGEVTELLRRLNAGDETAGDRILELLYDELRRLAAACLRGERPDHTLQPTALVHEAWLRLASHREWNLQDRTHFFGVASRAMRRVLVDHARAAGAQKRGAACRGVPLEDALAIATEDPVRLLDIHNALDRLEKLDPHRSRLAEMRLFGGLSAEEIAEAMGVTPRTVNRQWRAARAFLAGELSGHGRGG